MSHCGVTMKKQNLLLTVATLIISLGLALTASADTLRGQASYYADSLQGGKTASGAPYDKNAMTAAHRTLPLGTVVRVTYLKTGKTAEVTINDRGPYVKNRIIDLSGAAAQRLGLKDDGVGEVEIEILK